MGFNSAFKGLNLHAEEGHTVEQWQRDGEKGNMITTDIFSLRFFMISLISTDIWVFYACEDCSQSAPNALRFLTRQLNVIKRLQMKFSSLKSV